MATGGIHMREREFAMLVAQALPIIFGKSTIDIEPKLDSGDRPDFVVTLENGESIVVEVKAYTPSTQSRLDHIIRQIQSYKQGVRETRRYGAPRGALVVPGPLSPDRIKRLRDAGVDLVLDGPRLHDARPDLPWPEELASPTRDSSSQPWDRRVQHPLVDELQSVAPGRAEWSKYQRIVRDILAATLSPPLNSPLDEHANETRVNRRDIVFPNYANEGFWKFVRDHYEAHFVVVDAKNYVGNVKKKEILQVANYLSGHGAGLFGIIACRSAADRSAETTRREQWVIHRKMIIILNDEDLIQMLSASRESGDPSAVIRQKIEDFRLGF